MEKQIYDKKNGLWYELNENYYLPYCPKKNSVLSAYGAATFAVYKFMLIC